MRTFFFFVALVLLQLPTSLFAQFASPCCLYVQPTVSDSSLQISGAPRGVLAWPDQEELNRSRSAFDRIFIETVTGVFVSAVVSVPAAVVGLAIGPSLGDNSGENPGVTSAGLGLIGGAALGSALGVHWAGNGLGDEGDFQTTFVGGLAGAGCFLLTANLYEDFWPAIWGLPTLGALIGHKLSAARMRSQSAEAPDGRVQLLVVPLERGGLGLGISYAF